MTRRKRILDLTMITLGAVVWIPVLLVAALAVLLFAGRPVLYRSNRLVTSERAIKVVKFRTMIKNADKVANRDTVPIDNQVRFLNIPADSPLYTRVGRILERCALTELPQLFHVIAGSMTVVGNRPLPHNVMSCLLEENPQAADRFLTPAGLTGPAQLVGRDALTDDERLHIEAAYCRAALSSYRMRLDVAILASTIFGVLHLRKPMDYQGVMAFIERHSRQLAPAHTDALPAKVDGYADLDTPVA